MLRLGKKGIAPSRSITIGIISVVLLALLSLFSGDGIVTYLFDILLISVSLVFAGHLVILIIKNSGRFERTLSSIDNWKDKQEFPKKVKAWIGNTREHEIFRNITSRIEDLEKPITEQKKKADHISQNIVEDDIGFFLGPERQFNKDIQNIRDEELKDIKRKTDEIITNTKQAEKILDLTEVDMLKISKVITHDNEDLKGILRDAKSIEIQNDEPAKINAVEAKTNDKEVLIDFNIYHLLGLESEETIPTYEEKHGTFDKVDNVAIKDIYIKLKCPNCGEIKEEKLLTDYLINYRDNINNLKCDNCTKKFRAVLWTPIYHNNTQNKETKKLNDLFHRIHTLRNSLKLETGEDIAKLEGEEEVFSGLGMLREMEKEVIHDAIDEEIGKPGVLNINEKTLKQIRHFIINNKRMKDAFDFFLIALNNQEKMIKRETQIIKRIESAAELKTDFKKFLEIVDKLEKNYYHLKHILGINDKENSHKDKTGEISIRHYDDSSGKSMGILGLMLKKTQLEKVLNKQFKQRQEFISRELAKHQKLEIDIMRFDRSYATDPTLNTLLHSPSSTHPIIDVITKIEPYESDVKTNFPALYDFYEFSKVKYRRDYYLTAKQVYDDFKKLYERS